MSVMSKKPVLGRGLGALMKDADKVKKNDDKSAVVNTTSAVNLIDITFIEPNPYQPRTHFDEEVLQELADSIKIHGIIQPMTLRKLSENKYQIISGERRWRASKLVGLKEVPAYVRTANDEQMLEMGLIENIQREDLNAMEVALSYQRLISEFNLNQEQLGDRVGKKRSTVTNYLRLLKLPPDIQAALRDEEVSMGHARALVNIEKSEVQLSIFNKIIQDDLSVRKTEELVREYNKPVDRKDDKKNTANGSVKKSVNPEIVSVQNKLTSHFGTKIQINADDKVKGEIKIPFVSAEDLNRILEILEII